MSTATRLTQNDTGVLSLIFDPEAAPTCNVLIDASLPSDPVILDAQTLTDIKGQEKTIILQVESVLCNPEASRRKEQVLSKASQDIEALLELYPNSASLHNDFAQISRLQFGDSLLVSSDLSAIAQASRVIFSLDSAINLLTPKTPQTAISPIQARTLANSHMQRGAVYHAASKQFTKNISTQLAVESLKGWSKADFEEAASRDFFRGGRYGNEIGKALAVHTNPTAKLCGQIVQDAMRREYAPANTS